MFLVVILTVSELIESFFVLNTFLRRFLFFIFALRGEFLIVSIY